MRQTKLIALLKNLDALEMKHFGEFVASPFFNKDKRLWTIVQMLRKHHPDFTTRTLVKAEVFKKLFPGQPISLSLQNKMLHTIASLLEDFLVWNRLQQQSNKKEFLLLESFKKRGMDKQFFSKAEKLRLALADKKVGDMDYHYDNYYLNFLIYGHPNLPKAKGDEYAHDYNLSLDQFFYGAKFKSIAGIRCFKKYFKGDADGLDGDQLLEFVDKDKLSGPQKAFYLLAVAFGAEITVPKYYELKDFVFKELHTFGSDLVDIYQLLFNYGVYCPLKDKKDRELFDLYVLGLENDLLLENGYLLEVNFNNLIILACRLKRFEWAKKFLEEKIDLIYIDNRKNVEAYSDAYISYSEGKYEEAVRKLMNGDLEFSIQFYTVNAKFVLLKTYYLMDDFDNLYRFMDSLNVFLRRNTIQISKENQKGMLNFVSHLKKIYQSDNKNELLDLKKRMEKEPIYSKKWLLEQIDLKL